MNFPTLTALKTWADHKIPVYLPYDAGEVNIGSHTLPRDLVEMQKDGFYHYFRQDNGFELLMSSKNSLVEGVVK